MNEQEELKRKLGELYVILRRLAQAWLDRAWKWLNEGKTTGVSLRAIGAIAVGCVLIGVFLGSLFSGGGHSEKSKRKIFESPSILRILFGKSIPVPGLQKDGSFVFSNFEKDSDLKAWTMNSSKLEISSSHQAEGSKSGQVIFYGGVELSAITMQNYFESRKAQTNWSAYESLAFDIFNSQADSERLILQIKDRSDNRFKMDLHCPGGQMYSFKIPLNKISGQVDVRNIGQVSIFRWDSKIETMFYVDSLRLIPGHAGGEDMAKADAESFFEKAPAPKERPVHMMNYGFDKVKQLWTVVDPTTQRPMTRVPFIIKDESGAVRNNWPAQGGFPFPPGELTNEKNIKIRNAAQEEFPFQTRVLARWPDKSIRWLQIDLQSQISQPLAGQGYYLDYAPDIAKPEYSSPLTLTETPEAFRVETGAMAFTVSKTHFYLFDEAYLDLNSDGKFTEDELVASKVPISLSFRGKKHFGHLDKTTYKVEVEEKGTEKIGLKASGWFQAEDGNRYGQWIVRIHAFKGKSYVRVYHTFVYTGYPQNHYNEKYKELKLPENETIEAVQIEIPVNAHAGEKKVTFGVEGTNPANFVNPGSVSLYQSAFDANTIEAEGSVISENAQVLGWADVSDTVSGVAVAVHDFKENFPKEYTYNGKTNELSMNLWPKRAGDLDLQTTADAYGPEAIARGSAFGLAKTHELLFYFHKGGVQEASVDQEARAFNEPLLIRVNPYWTDRTGVLGRLYPVHQKYATEESVLERLFDWAARQQKNFKWYGMINFGDTMSWYRHEDDDKWYPEEGWHPVGRWGWYNCEGEGLHSGALLQYVRSGKWKYFEFGENLARHIMDVDTVHYNTITSDSRLKKIDADFSQVGSMHRHNGNHWGGRNELADHTNVYGLLLYYYLTGYERAFDVAKESGSFFLKNKFTYTGHADIAPHRAFANALWGDVQLYQATWDETYKKAADKIMEIYVKGQNADGSFLENYNPMAGEWAGEKHQLYMGNYAVPAIVAYHELTQDKEVLAVLEKAMHFLMGANKETLPNVINGLAYLYFATGKSEYVQTAEESFKHLMGQQQVSSDPLWDGMIYKKLIYHRPNSYLFSCPWIFAALEDSFEKQGL